MTEQKPLRNYRCTRCPETVQAEKMPAEKKPELCKGNPQGKHDWVWDQTKQEGK